MKTSHQINTNKRHDVFITPEPIIQKVKRVFGGEIDLDPATMPHNPTGANHYFSDWLFANSRQQDGLEENWARFNTVYVNPPFSGTKLWVNKVLDEKIPTIMLTKFDARTQWFDLAMTNCNSAIALKGYTYFYTQFGQPCSSAYAQNIALFLFNCKVLKSSFISKFATSGYFIN